LPKNILFSVDYPPDYSSYGSPPHHSILLPGNIG